MSKGRDRKAEYRARVDFLDGLREDLGIERYKRTSMEILVVKTEDLADVVKVWIKKIHPEEGAYFRTALNFPNQPLRGEKENIPVIQGNIMLAAYSGVSRELIDRLVWGRQESKFTHFSLADALVTAMQEPFAFYDGRLPVLANPLLSRKKWLQKCYAAGVTDPDSLVSV